MPRTREEIEYRAMHNIHAPTVMFLSKGISSRKIAQIYRCTYQVIDRIISGKSMLYNSEKDRSVIKALGLKLCESCGERLVPIVPITVRRCEVKLSKICQMCYRFGESGIIPEHTICLKEPS